MHASLNHCFNNLVVSQNTEMIERHEGIHKKSSHENKCESVSLSVLTLSDAHVTLDELSKRRKNFPITTLALESQVLLHQRLRLAKTLLSDQKNIDNFQMSKNGNLIFALHQKDSSIPFCYFKKSSTFKHENGILEKLMYDIANIMGFEENFVPTSQVAFSTKPVGFDRGIVVNTWNAKGELVKKTLSKAVYKGSFQPSQDGISLDDYCKTLSSEIKQESPSFSGPIPREQIIKCSLIIAVMGFFDAHSKNIIIDKNGVIKFFDNTRGMPHSNGCHISVKQESRVSFRSALLKLPDCYDPFTPEERSTIKLEIEKCEKNFIHLKLFLEQKYIEQKISRLPNHWMNLDCALEAMGERIENLKIAINDPRVTTLTELSLRSQPNLRFIAAIVIITYNFQDFPLNDQPSDDYVTKLQQNTFDLINGDPLETYMIACANEGFPLATIKEWCDDLNLSFHDILKRISTNKECEVPVITSDDDVVEIYKSICSLAKYDLKEVPSQEIPKLI